MQITSDDNVEAVVKKVERTIRLSTWRGALRRTFWFIIEKRWKVFAMIFTSAWRSTRGGWRLYTDRAWGLQVQQSFERAIVDVLVRKARPAIVPNADAHVQVQEEESGVRLDKFFHTNGKSVVHV